jgi:lipopolysaccharide exporter
MNAKKIVTSANATASLARGAAWALAMRWSVRGMGLISTSVLARYLKPEDYGLIAMAFLVVGMVEAFLGTGTSQALVRMGNDVGREYIDSAWSMRGIQGIVIGLVLAISAPFASGFFDEPRLTSVLLVLSVCLAVIGFSNIGMTLAFRDLQYRVEFKRVFISKLIGVISTFIGAYFYRDYRALLIGLVAGYIADLLLSYFLHPYRPSWCASKMKELWGVSKWLLMTGVGGFLLHRFDQLVAGKVGTTHQYGLYTVGSDIGVMAAGEIGGTLARPLFPTLANLKHDWPAAENTTLNLLETIVYMVLPLGVGLAMLSTEAAMVLLGPQWLESTPYIAGFALISAVVSCLAPLGTLLTVAGYVKAETTSVWAEFLVFVFFSVVFMNWVGLLGLIYARAIGVFVKGLVLLYYVHAKTNLQLRRLVLVIQNPLISAICMALVLYFLPRNIFSWSLINLFALVFVGAFVYIFICILLWRARGKPDGFVKYVFGKLDKIVPFVFHR